MSSFKFVMQNCWIKSLSVFFKFVKLFCKVSSTKALVLRVILQQSTWAAASPRVRHSPDDDHSILIETSSCNLQFFSELITTQLRDFHMVSPQVVFSLPIFLTMQSYKFYLKPSCFSWTSVASTCSYSTTWSKPVNCLFWLLTQMCTQGHFWLDFTVILTTLNNTTQCFYQSKTDDSFWSVNVLTTRKVWQCSTFKCTRYTLASISTFWLILTRAVIGGLSALDIPWQVYQHFDWFWPVQS